jgi:valyl-tRNA synthetase
VASIPEQVTLEGLEEKWSSRWDEWGIFRFDPTVPREAVFAIDTPPPTVSGSLHVGHAFSYTHADIIARYQRMQGKEVFYPMGWDDNGVPTERRVQNYFGVRCDPDLPYDPSFVPTPGQEGQRPIARGNFIELCGRLTAEDEKVFEQLWRRLGLSVDWSLTYTTVGPHARRVSQAAFLDLLARNEIYQSFAPTLWDVDFQTAVAQAELEDRELTGKYYRVGFPLVDGGDLEIETSRPELLPACVAVVVHPDDARYHALVGRRARTPLFGIEVPIVAHPLADPDHGTGAAMVCTFGDLTDVTWWRELGLPLRLVIGRDGRLTHNVDFTSPEFPSTDPAQAAHAYRALAGKRAAGAREEIARLLEDVGALRGQPVTVTRPVKFYEKGDRPLEVVASRQWFCRLLAHREELARRGRELDWLPPYMQVRYDNWVSGLNADWNLSRQRFFGIPIPVWYPLDDEASPDFDHPILPAREMLPVDPLAEPAPGYDESQRGKPGGFIGDPDVMDTWATSSLTPLLVTGWPDDAARFSALFPMDLRPQGQEIIRTWLFYTMVRAHLGFDTVPFRRVLISGFVLDPDRKKMSKSKGNVVTPMPLIERFGADAIRYWAAGGRPGTDTAADEGQMRIGRRLAIKIANATKFVLSLASEPATDFEAEAIDVSLIERLDAATAAATASMEAFDYTGALEVIERFFWEFCDDYLELAKMRAYGGNPDPSLPLVGYDVSGTSSARTTLVIASELLLRAFAPFLPFVTEEAWSWSHDSSVHVAPWPQPGEGMRRLRQHGHVGTPGAHFEIAAGVLAEIRKAKSAAHRSQKARVTRLEVHDTGPALEALGAVLSDLAAAGSVELMALVEGDVRYVEVELAPAEP